MSKSWVLPDGTKLYEGYELRLVTTILGIEHHMEGRRKKALDDYLRNAQHDRFVKEVNDMPRVKLELIEEENWMASETKTRIYLYENERPKNCKSIW